MSGHELGSLSSHSVDDDAIPVEPRESEPVRQDVPREDIDDASALARIAREQLARDIADIERATAALRRAEPALESWVKPAASSAPKPRPLWLLIGVLWVSTALVTAGAVVAIASFAG